MNEVDGYEVDGLDVAGPSDLLTPDDARRIADRIAQYVIVGPPAEDEDVASLRGYADCVELCQENERALIQRCLTE